MATPSKKPRDIKNLKARLGRTITPGQQGVPGPVPGAGSVPPPTLGGGLPSPAVAPAPAAGLGARPAGNPLGGPAASVPAPAFGPAARPAAAPAPGARPLPGGLTPSGRPAGPASPVSGPFAPAAPGVGERKVTLVIDDSAVKDDEIGRKSRATNMVLAVIGIVVGLGVGLGIGMTNSENNLWNMAVADGKDIYAKVNEASKALDVAKGHLKTLSESTGGGAGKQASVDYKAVEALVAMERPFGANEFSRRRYRAFPTNVVDDLFEYYNGVNLLWDKFSLLGAMTAGQAKREALDKSARAADDLMSRQYGMVVTKNGDIFTGGLVLLGPKPPVEGEEPPEEGAAPIFMVSSREGGREVERTLFMGQDDVAENYGNYVFMIDKGRSMGTLGVSANLFGELRGEITTTQGLMTKTLESQGRLIKALGEVATLSERFAF